MDKPHFTIYMPQELIDVANDQAAKEDISKSQLIRKILRDYIKKVNPRD